MDKYDKKTRSRMMAAVRSMNNRSTELRLRAYLVKYGIRGWKMHVTSLIGKPDFAFPSERIVVFVDGCFWHSCPQCQRIPGSNKKYWVPKLRKNQEKDRRANEILQNEGWTVLRFWEHDVRSSCRGIIYQISETLRSKSTSSS